MLKMPSSVCGSGKVCFAVIVNMEKDEKEEKHSLLSKKMELLV